MSQNPFPMLALAAGLVIFSPAAAQAGQAQTLRLSPEEIAKVRDAGAEATTSDFSEGRVDNGVHGEIGMMIGTNGARGVFGTAAIPLGQNAGAVVSVEDSRFGRR
jgi:hypothetical protein